MQALPGDWAILVIGLVGVVIGFVLGCWYHEKDWQ